jgi:hypothetical protein
MPSLEPQRNTAIAGIGLVLISALTWLAPAHAGEAVVAAVQDAAAPQDYYARRAAEILKRDKDLDTPAPHPLAAAYPNHSVVICEAGCGSERGAKVVFMERREAPAPAGHPERVASSKAGAAAKEPTTIDCVGGCYDTPRRYQAADLAGGALPRADVPARPHEKREPFDPRY